MMLNRPYRDEKEEIIQRIFARNKSDLIKAPRGTCYRHPRPPRKTAANQKLERLMIAQDVILLVRKNLTS